MYRITDIGNINIEDMNIFGAVVGEESPDGVHLRAYVDRNGVITDIGTLGGPDALAHGINDLGTITGIADLADGSDSAFLYSYGMMRNLGGLGGTYGEGNDVNDLEVVAGDSNLTGDATYHAFLWEKGSLKDLGTLGGSNSLAISVNVFGETTGRADLPGFTDECDPVCHAFIYSHGKMTDIGLLAGDNSDYSEGYRINDLGEVTGTAHFKDNTEFHAFAYRESRLVDLGTLGSGVNSHGYGINNRGQIVGRSTLVPNPPDDVLDPYDAFLFEDGTMYDLNALIDDEDPLKAYVQLTSAVAITDFGWIAAEGVDARTGIYQGYLLKTVPRRTPWFPDKKFSAPRPASRFGHTQASPHRWRGRVSEHDKVLGRP
jgi:probable HAF family extracellular repeat protein